MTPPVWFGTPEQSVVLDFDTGSSETWVDPPCTTLEGEPVFEEICRKFGTYLPEQSENGFAINDTSCPPRWITYGSGAVYVSYYKDTIRITGEFHSFLS